MRKPVISPLAAKAIGLLRGHYVYTSRPVSTGIRGSWRIPEFVLDYGIFNTHTGARVLGFGRQTFRELYRGKLLSKPAEFQVLRRHSADRVYTLSPRAAEVVVIAAVIHAVRETFEEVAQ